MSLLRAPSNSAWWPRQIVIVTCKSTTSHIVWDCLFFHKSLWFNWKSGYIQKVVFLVVWIKQVWFSFQLTTLLMTLKYFIPKVIEFFQLQFDSRWQSWWNGSKNQNPKKFLDQKLTHKKSHADFPSLRNFQKALNNTTWKIKFSKTRWLTVLSLQIYAVGVCTRH